MKATLGGLLGKIPRPTPAMAVALLALLIAASGAAVAAGSFTASDGTITACRDNKTGVLRVINAQGGQTCTAKETTITWKDGITGKVADSVMLGGQAPGAYGAVVTGRINGVRNINSTDEFQFAAATGISDANLNPSSVQTLSPGRDVILRDFTAKLTLPAFDPQTVRSFYLVIDGDVASARRIDCEIVGRVTTCTSASPIRIPAGSVISLGVRTTGEGATTDALFGYRLTAT
jgi:hypothetical protein